MRTKTSFIGNSEDVIDSRDIIARIKYLEITDPEDMDREELDEWKALRALESEAEGYAPDWRDGAILIRESYFEDYARALAEDIGAIDPKAGWPTQCIDWEQAARELRQDYTEVDFDGVAYFVQ